MVTLIALPLLAGLLVSGYGIWESSHISIKRTILQTPKIPLNAKRMRAAAFADLHLQNPVRYGLLNELVEKINAQKPDVILALGDIVVGSISNVERVIEMLSELKAPLGKYFIYGNHEISEIQTPPVQLLRQAGFKALINEGVVLGNINLIGISDAREDDFQGTGLPPLINNGLFTILMEHRPIAAKNNQPFFDLQLSGHTHGGQVFPFMYLAARRYPHINGLYKIGEQKWIYTNPGVGTYGPPIRLLCPPEITIIDLVPTVKKSGKR